MKVVTIILGVLLVIGGFYCIFTPVATYSALSIVIGAAMVIEGFGSIITWNELRKQGLASGWTLAGGILSIVLGVLLLGSNALQISVDLFIAFVIAFWLIEFGIVRIVVAVSTRNDPSQNGGSGWIIQVVLGVLTVILGVLCFFNPLSVMIGVGFMLGVSIVLTGVGLVVAGIELK